MIHDNASFIVQKSTHHGVIRDGGMPEVHGKHSLAVGTGPVHRAVQSDSRDKVRSPCSKVWQSGRTPFTVYIVWQSERDLFTVQHSLAVGTSPVLPQYILTVGTRSVLRAV